MTASVLRLRAEGHTAHQLGARQGGDAVIVDGQNTQLVVPRRRQVTQQEVLVVGWDHPEREEDRDKDIFSFPPVLTGSLSVEQQLFHRGSGCGDSF